jgi:glutamate/tyrosine decarboxylase-like PLP-dependent enzyme
LRTSGRFEVFEPQELSIVCFRYEPAGGRQSAEKLDEFNKALLEKIQLGGKAFLSGTVIGGKFWLRACIVNPRSHDEDTDLLPQVIEEAARYALAAREQKDDAKTSSA